MSEQDDNAAFAEVRRLADDIRRADAAGEDSEQLREKLDRAVEDAGGGERPPPDVD